MCQHWDTEVSRERFTEEAQGVSSGTSRFRLEDPGAGGWVSSQKGARIRREEGRAVPLDPDVPKRPSRAPVVVAGRFLHRSPVWG